MTQDQTPTELFYFLEPLQVGKWGNGKDREKHKSPTPALSILTNSMLCGFCKKVNPEQYLTTDAISRV